MITRGGAFTYRPRSGRTPIRSSDRMQSFDVTYRMQSHLTGKTDEAVLRLNVPPGNLAPVWTGKTIEVSEDDRVVSVSFDAAQLVDWNRNIRVERAGVVRKGEVRMHTQAVSSVSPDWLEFFPRDQFQNLPQGARETVSIPLNAVEPGAGQTRHDLKVVVRGVNDAPVWTKTSTRVEKNQVVR